MPRQAMSRSDLIKKWLKNPSFKCFHYAEPRLSCRICDNKEIPLKTLSVNFLKEHLKTQTHRDKAASSTQVQPSLKEILDLSESKVSDLSSSNTTLWFTYAIHLIDQGQYPIWVRFGHGCDDGQVQHPPRNASQQRLDRVPQEMEPSSCTLSVYLIQTHWSYL